MCYSIIRTKTHILLLYLLFLYYNLNLIIFYYKVAIELHPTIFIQSMNLSFRFYQTQPMQLYFALIQLILNFGAIPFNMSKSHEADRLFW